MNPSQIILTGSTVDQLLASVREIVRDEIRSIPKPEKEKPYLSTPEAAELIHRSMPDLYRMTAEGKIPFIKKSGGKSCKLLFKRADLIAWLESSRQEIISNQ